MLVTLDRPPLNALNAETLEEGAGLLAKLAAEPPAGGVVLTGANGVFTAGVDIKQAADADREMRRRLFWGINDFCAALIRLPCACICAVPGHAIGAGGIIAIAADRIRMMPPAASLLRNLRSADVSLPPGIPCAPMSAPVIDALMRLTAPALEGHSPAGGQSA